MSPSGLRKSLVAFVAFIGLVLIPIPSFAQHGGGGGHSGGGGGGGFHGSAGGGGFHGGGGYECGGRSYSEGSSDRSGGFRGGMEGRSSRGMTGRSGSEAGRNDSSEGSRSSNIRPAMNDGQWHSFGSSGTSARSGVGRTSVGHTAVGTANTHLSARNEGFADGNWHSFSSSRGASGFSGGSREPGFGWRGNGWRGGWGGFGWGGFGRWGWGGWGFGFGWPYWGGFWGPYWGFAWNPWWYGSYWYGPWPAYSDYPDYSYDWSDGPPPYRPDSNKSSDPNANLSPNFNLDSGLNSSPNDDGRRFDLNRDTNMSSVNSTVND
jgi:hypothetical protein